MTGVIFVTTEAVKNGYSPHDPLWANLGQGAPEVSSVGDSGGELFAIKDTSETREYGSVAGIIPLRQAVADLYNSLYRKDAQSKYTAENVAIASGGRLSLTRIAAALGTVNIGHFIPDYTAYEELLNTFRAFTPVPILLQEEKGYSFSAEDLRTTIRGLGLGALLASNPSNPTGRVIADAELKGWVDVAREEGCALIMDEFYSQYHYGGEGGVSAARYVDDVNKDPVVIVDGLTKNMRRPGWRIAWTVAPKEIIRVVESVGSFLDGGAPHPLEAAAVPLLQPERFQEESRALRELFIQKRDRTLLALKKMQIEVPVRPDGAFYAWANLSRLPEPLRDGMRFFTEALKEKVIVVPGEFFDVNPGKRRESAAYKEYIRVSFGPSLPEIERGLEGIARVIAKFS